MALDSAELSDTQIEKLLLRAILQPGGDTVWSFATGPLKTYHWGEAVHEALFAALKDLRARRPTVLRELLPAALTRRGFPDVAWEEFLDPITISDEEARALVQRLVQATGR